MSPINATYLQATPLLDFDTPAIQTLIAEKEWQSLTTSERIGAIYHFIQNDVAFGYNKRDDIAASEVLKDGLGQCNTKATILHVVCMGLPLISDCKKVLSRAYCIYSPHG